MNRLLIWMLVPAVALAATVAAILSAGLFRGDVGVPPIEHLTIERVILDEDGITAIVRAEGSEPVSLAQVQVGRPRRPACSSPASASLCKATPVRASPAPRRP